MTGLKNYIGLSVTGHDNALAIVNSSGKVVFAEATERYMQNKRAFCCPPDDFLRVKTLIKQYCEPGAELVVVKTWSDQAVNALELEAAKISFEMEKNSQSPYVWQQRYIAYKNFIDLFLPSIRNAGNNIKSHVASNPTWQMEMRAYDHHLTHAATGYYSSGFEKAACLVIDGLGEATALAAFDCNGKTITPINTGKPSFGGFASLGLFYGLTLCQLCGFDGWKGEEWKVMGLAAYGEFDEDAYQLMRRYMKVNDLHLEYTDDSRDAYIQLMSKMRKPGQPAEEVANLAFTGQQVFSEWVSELLQNLYKRGISDQLVLVGGCALNSSFAGKIIEQTPFKQVHIPSAPADDGNAVGAALLAYHKDNPTAERTPGILSPYLGSEFNTDVLNNMQTFSKIPGLKKLEAGQAPLLAAQLLADNKILGWAQGRAEFGPRALGNRSILADPRDHKMKEEINMRVKFREEFRPFAPSILAEYGDDYFYNYQETPYMERTLRFKEEVINKIPAVVHEDFTGRLQSVKEEWNPAYYTLIKEFYRLTGVPVVLNTSFNVMGKPIVHSVEDALAVFYTSGIDVMFINDYILVKDLSVFDRLFSEGDVFSEEKEGALEPA